MNISSQPLVAISVLPMLSNIAQLDAMQLIGINLHYLVVTKNRPTVQSLS